VNEPRRRSRRSQRRFTLARPDAADFVLTRYLALFLQFLSCSEVGHSRRAANASSTRIQHI
jgi:hypothetical protein